MSAPSSVVRLLASLIALAGWLITAPAAHATTCQQDDFVVFGGTFIDCAGNENELPSFGSGFLRQNSGPHQGNDWFTDIHITYLDPQITGIDGGFFRNLEDDVDWDVEGDFQDDISFIAPNFAAAVDPNEDYHWEAYGFGDLTGLNGLNIRIRYTMDVPEPGSAALLAAGWLALGFAGRRRSRRS